MVGCDDEFEPEQPSLNSSGPGLTEITFSSFDISSGPDANNLDDGTFVTVTPLAIGASSFVVNFGHGDPVTISENGGSASYDYPNVEASAVYAVTVTAKSDQGLADVSFETLRLIMNQQPYQLYLPLQVSGIQMYTHYLATVLNTTELCFLGSMERQLQEVL